ncbi:phage minor capsid protein [Limosilactobacillus fermentum]|nr:phage minor capsid protein [Limosilactobacillus fermentum]MCQ2006632.1 phage minor capsid protein [Limosilactobacillus fermentum]MDA3761441.1 phage minor capsid protein [Limosilactobacillus fermentum]MDQ2152975.1 phage minor capsid protein [Limosilactobacillus fermentum]WGW21898.1 phage minor capsid protein [Limosilactobacillus fermentum]WLF74331.1 phage minor capsid protein [Limosilactobacillus fermentum]
MKRSKTASWSNQQRARERAIRDAKKRLRVAEQLGDDQMVSQTKTLLRARQAKLRDFIKETNAGKKNPILVRDYSREKIVTKIPISSVEKVHAYLSILSLASLLSNTERRQRS